MPIFIAGSSITLAAGASGTISFKSPVTGSVEKISVTSTGRCKVEDIEITGQPDFFDGVCELDSLKEHGNLYHLIEPQPIEVGQFFNIKLLDISGAPNEIYVTIHIRY